MQNPDLKEELEEFKRELESLKKELHYVRMQTGVY